MAVAVSSVVGYLLLIALTLAIKDIPSVLNAVDARGNHVPAVIAILVGALGERIGGLFTALTAMAMWFCGLSAVTWSSRTIYAFARDGGMPGSRLWKQVSPKHRTPAPAVWLSVAIAVFATLSSGAYAVVTSISVIGLYFSYIIPVYLAWRVRGTSAGSPARSVASREMGLGDQSGGDRLGHFHNGDPEPAGRHARRQVDGSGDLAARRLVRRTRATSVSWAGLGRLRVTRRVTRARRPAGQRRESDGE